ncbi:MAG TPA: phosphate ABC transporter ATP-binding protein PstB [Planctomycetota bacterium]|nr:phosphate ABC transporter ATP-binding protein PstB [Planctomycetota bacterium]
MMDQRPVDEEELPPRPTAPSHGAPPSSSGAKIRVEKLDAWYGSFHALKGISLTIPLRQITAMIGPSGCGKSTLLRCLDRMNDGVRGFRAEGRIELDGQDIYARGFPLTALRKRVGMVFQRPNPFPLSVFENVAYGPRIHGMRNGPVEENVERSLRATGLWDELKDRLQANALSLSAEQQQRLCISRLLAVQPEVLLMDEPCSALDPIATARVEELMQELKREYTIVIVTHNMQQASRASDSCGFMWLGELVEFAATQVIFTRPHSKQTEGYVTGRFG